MKLVTDGEICSATLMFQAVGQGMLELVKAVSTDGGVSGTATNEVLGRRVGRDEVFDGYQSDGRVRTKIVNAVFVNASEGALHYAASCTAPTGYEITKFLIEQGHPRPAPRQVEAGRTSLGLLAGQPGPSARAH